MIADHLNRHGLIRADDSILIIIDVQERLVPAVAEKDALVDNIRRLAAFSAIADIPVVLTEQGKLGPTMQSIRESLPQATTLEKIHFDCFASPGFPEKIAETGRTTLLLTGLEAHICVAQTALHALPKYKVHVVADAISSRSIRNRDIAIMRMAQAGATITTTEMLIYELLQRAGTDQFRAALSLVK
jgi:nicotinamidase-related amidase